MALGDLLKTIALPENQPNLIRMDRLGNFWIINRDSAPHLECVTPSGAVIVNINLGYTYVGGLAVDRINDFVYISIGIGGSQFQKYNLSGTLLNARYGGPGAGVMAVSAAGDWAFVTVGNYVQSMKVDDSTNFTYIEFYPAGGNSGCNIIDMAFDASGNLWLVMPNSSNWDSGQGMWLDSNVMVISPTGSVLATINIPSATYGYVSPCCIAFDSNGFAWVGDNGNGYAYKINATTHAIVGTHQFNPWEVNNIATDNSGNVWFDEPGSSGIFYCFNTVGMVQRTTFNSPYYEPIGMVCDANNNIWVVFQDYNIGGTLAELQGYVAAPPPITKKNTLQIF